MVGRHQTRAGLLGSTNRRDLQSYTVQLDATLPHNSEIPKLRQRPASAPLTRTLESTLPGGHRVKSLLQPYTPEAQGPRPGGSARPLSARPVPTKTAPIWSSAYRAAPLISAAAQRSREPDDPWREKYTPPPGGTGAVPAAPAHRPAPTAAPAAAKAAVPSRAGAAAAGGAAAAAAAAAAGSGPGPGGRDGSASQREQVVARVLKILKTRTRQRGSVRPIFRAMDDDGWGGISHEEFVQGMRRWGLREPAYQLHWVAQAIDDKSEGCITYDSFSRAMVSNQMEEGMMQPELPHALKIATGEAPCVHPG